MKKKLSRLLALMLAMLMALSVTAMADDITDTSKATITDPATGATVTFADAAGDKILVTYEQAGLTGQYLIMMITSTGGKMKTPRADTILYIDQVEAKDADADGIPDISFEVYPSVIKDSVIMIYGLIPDGNGGTVKSLQAAIVEAKYILGDVDRSGVVDIGDVVAILRHLAKYEPVGEFQEEAGDVDNSGGVDIGDVVKLLRVFALYEEL